MAGRLSCRLLREERRDVGKPAKAVEQHAKRAVELDKADDDCREGEQFEVCPVAHASAPSISRIAKAASRLIAFRSGRYAARSCGTCVTPPGPLGSLASTSFRLTLATSGARLVSAFDLIGVASAPNSAK